MNTFQFRVPSTLFCVLIQHHIKKHPQMVLNAPQFLNIDFAQFIIKITKNLFLVSFFLAQFNLKLLYVYMQGLFLLLKVVVTMFRLNPCEFSFLRLFISLLQSGLILTNKVSINLQVGKRSRYKLTGRTTQQV